MEFVARQIVPDQEAQTADDDQHTDRQADKGIVHIGREGGKGGAAAHEVEARVAESGDGVKDREINALSPAEIRHKADGKQDRAGKFENESEGHDTADQIADAGEGEVARRLHQHLAVIQAHPLADGEGDQGDDGHEAQTAQLDQKQNNDLPEGRPAGEGVADDQTRHAGGAGGGKQRVKEV